MINPAAVTLLVGIFTFCVMIWVLVRTSSFSGYSYKVIGKIQLGGNIGQNFAVYTFDQNTCSHGAAIFE